MNSNTATPIARFNDTPILGFRPMPALMGIRTADEGGTGAGAGESGGESGTGQTADTTGQSTTTDTSTQGEAPVGGVEFKDLDPKTQDAVRELRREAATARTEKTTAVDQTKTQLQQEFDAKVKAITDALGITTPEGEKPDPDKLTAQLTAAQEAQATTQREIAVLRFASKAQANGDMLLDSKAFEATLVGVNPTDTAAIEAKINDWVTNHPSYKIGTADPGSGTGGAGTGGSTAAPRPTTLVDAFKAQSAGK